MKFLLSFAFVVVLVFSVTGQESETSKNPDKKTAGIVSITGKSFGPNELIGKVVVLNFWFTSCPPCLKEIPELNNIVDEYSGKDVVFLAFATDKKDQIEAFIAENPFKYNLIPEATMLMLRFLEPDKNGRMETAFPTHIVVDRTGKKTVYETGIKGVEVVKKELERQFKPVDNKAAPVPTR
ncbi:MAG: TlpA family protein disulfide reductase [Pyrinomonadaceae bacterium]|nr:TlpA family protein disulfide reductase [Pyrinomonadaceae bacterium]